MAKKTYTAKWAVKAGKDNQAAPGEDVTLDDKSAEAKQLLDAGAIAPKPSKTAIKTVSDNAAGTDK